MAVPLDLSAQGRQTAAVEDIIARLPEFELRCDRPCGQLLRDAGCTTFREAAKLVADLPYGRTDGRDFRRVLAEGRGTCSTKHALLAQTAAEHDRGVELVLAFFMMNGDNTPAVASVLAESSLSALPEAHCLLLWRGALIDLTHPGAARTWNERELLRWQVIEPSDIETEKVTRHRAFLKEWGESLEHPWSADALWELRERCIAALSTG